MAQPQLILDETGAPAFAVIPWDEYARLMAAYRNAGEFAHSGEAHSVEECFPVEVVDRLLAGENPIAVYREYRDMSPAELAEAAKISESELAEMESGSRVVPAWHLPAVAKALGLDCDDLT